MLHVGLLGVFRIAGVDSRTWAELGPAGRGLASFLFTYPGRSHRRERLADLFWPDLDVERARRALNSAIWRLRKLLTSQIGGEGGSRLETIGFETVLESGPWLDVDAVKLEQAAMLVLKQPAALHDTEMLSQVAAVLHCYRGPFLDGDDGDWILEERERMHSLFLRTATLVVCKLGTADLYDDAINLARLALRFDPYREALVRTLLVLLALDERRCEAIQFYRNWSRSLKSDLDIAPLSITQRVIEEVRNLESEQGFQKLRAHLSGSRQQADR
jgi:DNA-binding SARP family transcriptional activator